MTRKGTKVKDKRPDLRKRYAENNEKSFDDIFVTSAKKVNWICDKDKSHMWSARIAHMANDKAPCPHCKALENLLIDTHPEVAKEYSTANEKPLIEVKKSSNNKVIWECNKGHKWKAKISDRTRSTSSVCPECKKEKLSFVRRFPNAAKHYSSKNEIDINSPDFIASNVHLWECEKGHIRKATAWNVTENGKDEYNCAQCKKDANYLYINRPDLEEFFSKENTVNFYELSLFSGKKVLWECDKGHKWAINVDAMQKREEPCFECKKEKNSLTTLFPESEKEFSSKNKVEFSSLTHGSTKRIIWECEKGHEWTQTPKLRFKPQTNYLSPCPHCLREKNLVVKLYPELEKNYDKTNEIPFSELTTGIHKKVKVNYLCGHTKTQEINNFVKYTNCEQCSQWGTSMLEQELIEFVKSLLPDMKVLTNTRKLISPFELDVYIPELSIAIEFNGTYWHSEENGKDKNYHYNKWKQCADKGVQLFTVWEDDWCNGAKKEILKSMLAHKLGRAGANKLFARKTYVSTLSTIQAREFCDSHHIQGFTSGSVYLGLKDNKTDKLVAVSIWRKLGGEFFLDRYCTSTHVVGGLGKMLKVAKIQARDVYNCSHVVTFADREVSNGQLYEKLGFIKDKELRPDYKYVRNGQHREHKFNYRIARFKRDNNLKFTEGLTESELAKLNKLRRVWDCGKIRYILAIHSLLIFSFFCAMLTSENICAHV